jgi:hypothetical protein
VGGVLLRVFAAFVGCFLARAEASVRYDLSDGAIWADSAAGRFTVLLRFGLLIASPICA